MKVFLDTNVFVDWILFKNKMNRLENGVFEERYKNIASSFKLIENIINEKYKNVEAITSELAVAEIFSVLYEDAVNLKLYEQAIPTKYWTWKTVRKQNLLTEDEANELYYSIMKRIDELFGEEKVIMVEDSYNQEILAYLTLRLGISSHDAILLTTAIEEDCDYFITRDTRLKELYDVEWNELKKKKKIKIIPPKDALNKFKKLGKEKKTKVIKTSKH